MQPSAVLITEFFVLDFDLDTVLADLDIDLFVYLDEVCLEMGAEMFLDLDYLDLDL